MSAREHGTRARYVWGPGENDEPGVPCHCGACRAASTREASHRDRMIAYGRWQPYVDAGPAREHVRMLSRCGIGWKRAAELAGISTSSVSKLLYGGPGDRPPSRRIRPETAAAILAVQPSAAGLGDHAVVDATATHRRLQALVAVGWSQARLAARLGMTRPNFGTMMHDRGQVTAATERAVTVLYDQLWDHAPPENGQREKIAASRARNYARAYGWAPPAAWDDDTIADPDAGPADGWVRGKRLSAAGLADEGLELERLGHTRQQAADRLGVTKDALQAAISRTAAREAA